MEEIQRWDPNAFDDEEDAIEQEFSKVHLRVMKRNNRKYWTTIEGLSEDINIKKFLAKLKRELSCNGSVKSGVVTLQGDHRQLIKTILVREGITEDKHIVVHGF